MPIYKQNNGLESSTADHNGISYQNGDTYKAAETVFVHFTNGDIDVSTGYRRTEVVDELLFLDSRETHAIGEISDTHVGEAVWSPVALVFDRATSVQVVIDRLRVIKTALLERDKLLADPQNQA
jgi:hypothetical protein